MHRKEKLLSYVPIADYIARINGPTCEVVIHDTSDPEHSVIYITTPNMTGRTIGAGLTDYARELVDSRKYLTEDFEVNYLGTSPDGSRMFRSSTYFIREDDALIGLLCVNIDIGNLLEIRAAIDRAMVISPALLARENRETFVATIEESIEAALATHVLEGGNKKIPTAIKRRVALQLKRQGVFQMKGAVLTFAQRIGVSEQTVYRYLKEENP